MSRPALRSPRLGRLPVVRWLLAALAMTLLTLPLTATAAHAAGEGNPPVASVAAALARSPVYVDPKATALRVDAARLAPVVPAGTHVAVLPASAVPAGDQAEELPAVLSSKVGKGGTFVLLVDGQLYGASTTIPGRLPGELGTAQSALPPRGGDATGTLIALMRSLSGAGDLQDAPGPSRAGGPVGAGFLIGLGVAVLVGAVTLWWWLRRPARPRAPRPPGPPRDLVEIDHAGHIIRRVPARERDQQP